MPNITADGSRVVVYGQANGEFAVIAQGEYRRLRDKAPIAWNPHYGPLLAVSR